MSTIAQSTAGPGASIIDGAWRLDPARSSVALHVRHFYGLMSVKGDFADYDGTLDLGATPAVEIEVITEADHRELGMTWSPLGILRAPSKLIVRGRLVRRQGDRHASHHR